MSRTTRAGRLAAGLLAVLAGCRTPERAGLDVRHLGDAKAFAHCAALFKGETRPATPCVRPVPVARGKDVRVPAGGLLTVDLVRRELPKGPAQLSVEAYLYGDLTQQPIVRSSIDALDGVVSSRQHDRLLTDALGHLTALEAVPQQPSYVTRVPAKLTLRLPPHAAGRQVVFVVWAWPVPPADRRHVALPPVTPPGGAGLSIAFAVAEPGWARGSSPVLFTVSTPGPDGPIVLWNRTLDPSINAGDRGWQTAEVDLGGFAGRAIPIELTARIEQLPGIASFPLWARPVMLSPAADDAPPRPSFLLISLDTVRADHLTPYGYERDTTPALARLAADGVLFEQAMSHFPSTTASHMSMMTSLQPCAHGVSVPKLRLPAGVTTLAEALADGGYATAAVTEDALIKGDAGFERGFDVYRDLIWSEHEAAAFVRTPRPVTGLFGQGLALAGDWIERHADRPFFFFLHTYQPHVPFKVPAHQAALFPLPPGADDMQRKRADYDAGLRNTDDLLAGFLARLARRGILDRVVVVVTSDHGIEFGEHGGFGHARGVHDEQVHVPLVFRHPTLASGGRRVREVVPLVDLAPTLLELAGVPAPESFRGASVAAALRGEPLPVEPRAIAEQLWGKRQTLLREQRWAWIRTKEGVRLYDMERDPRQQRDLAATEAERAADGSTRIDAFRTACRDEARALRAGGSAAPLDPQRRRALELLGYVE